MRRNGTLLTVVGVAAFALVVVSAMLGTPAAAVNPATALTGSKVVGTATSTSTASATNAVFEIYAPTDGGFLTLRKSAVDVLRLPAAVTCTRALGAVDGGACSDDACAYAGAEVGAPCMLGAAFTPPTDVSQTCYVQDAGQVGIRSCCGRHFGNTGLDCGTLGAQNYQLRVLPK